MKNFSFKSKNTHGKVVSGSLQAETENEAVAELRRRGLTVISLGQGRGSASKSGVSVFQNKKAKKTGSSGAKGRIKSAELVIFTRQLATMVSAGIPLVEGLEILEEQTANRVFRAVLSECISDVRSGKDLSQSLGRHPTVFKNIYVNMVRSGEASGQLDITLDRLAEYQERAEELRGEIQSAMTYPVVSLTLVSGITLFLLVFIIPKFEEMFISLNVELPWITSALLSFSKYLQSNFFLMICALGAFVAGVMFYFKTSKGAVTKDWLILRIPVFGSLFSKVAISRFSRTFATLIQSGVPILGALEIVENTTGNRLFGRAIADASSAVREGETLGEPLARTGMFPPMVTRMISIGERSGALEALLEKIAEFYDAQVSASVKSLTSLIEPLLIAIMGFVVGSMVMAIFLPIFKLIGGMARGG